MESTKNNSSTGFWTRGSRLHPYQSLSPQWSQALATGCRSGMQPILPHFTEEQTEACSQTQ